MLKQLQAIVGADHVSDDPDACDLATSDIFEWPGRKSALLVASPRTTDETSAILRVLRAGHIPVIARGAGLSYTGTFAMPQAPVVVDTSRMNDISVNAPDRCATVGAGDVGIACSGTIGETASAGAGGEGGKAGETSTARR